MDALRTFRHLARRQPRYVANITNNPNAAKLRAQIRKVEAALRLLRWRRRELERTLEGR